MRCRNREASILTVKPFEFNEGKEIEQSEPSTNLVPTAAPNVSLDDLQSFILESSSFFSPAEHHRFDGDKFLGGFGVTKLHNIDYWTLRQRSAMLFNDNLYARGLIRRLITNEINTGLIPECQPDELILGVPEDSLTDWSEITENRFTLWGKNPELCHFEQRHTFGSIQRIARQEALVEGDVLVVMRRSPVTKLPMIQLISGSKVQTPLASEHDIRAGHKIVHGVELNPQNRVVAHWIRTDDGEYKRLPAFGEKSKRKLSWLVYGTDKRLDEVRGQPLLAIVLQSLKEVDRYRDSVQRKALINSILAMYITKTEDKVSSLPTSSGAVRRDQVTITDTGSTEPRKFNLASQIPGIVMEELQQGEEPKGFGSQGTDLNFGPFEEAIIQAVAWANEIPPEILRLAFSNNYSASQAAINEFKMYLEVKWAQWGEEFCTPIYIEWLISEVLLQKIQAFGLLQARRNPSQYDIFAAWTLVDWYGSIKPSTDIVKQAKGSKLLTDNAWSTNAREARGISGTKFNKNVKRIARENQALADAKRPLLELEKEFNQPIEEPAVAQTEVMADLIDDLKEMVASGDNDTEEFIETFMETLNHE